MDYTLYQALFNFVSPSICMHSDCPSRAGSNQDAVAASAVLQDAGLRAYLHQGGGAKVAMERVEPHGLERCAILRWLLEISSRLRLCSKFRFYNILVLTLS